MAIDLSMPREYFRGKKELVPTSISGSLTTIGPTLDIHSFIHTYVCMYLYIYIYIYIFMHTHTPIHR